MIEIAHGDINLKEMMPKEFKNQDIPGFAVGLNAPCLPEKKLAQDNKAYDHIHEQGNKAFHLEVAKSDTPFFTFLCQPRA
jgi:hypothetical protein